MKKKILRTNRDPAKELTSGGSGLFAATDIMYIETKVLIVVIVPKVVLDLTGKKNTTRQASGLAILDNVTAR